LPPLLFVTNEDRLAEQIGAAEAELVRQLIREAGHRLLLVSGEDADRIASAVRKGLRADTEGVVLVGGYRVIPAFRVDTLPKQAVDAGVRRRSDLDQFIVWSDDRYVDTDGDGLPELPVTRIPDARSALVCVRQLCAGPVDVKARSGVRNIARPFADSLVGVMATDVPLAVSHPNDSSMFQAAWVASPLTYLMLHGSDADGTRLWGEDETGHPLEAIAIADLPEALEGTFFSGCCWGALIVSQTARRAVPGHPLADRLEAHSVAITTLARGANAFVGCTGSHYSPKGTTTDRYGAPFHAAFLKATASGAPAASATWQAKQDYLAYITSITDAAELAYATKMLNEFTCLGLGW
jgi:hypothetical protein